MLPANQCRTAQFHDRRDQCILFIFRVSRDGRLHEFRRKGRNGLEGSVALAADSQMGPNLFFAGMRGLDAVGNRYGRRSVRNAASAPRVANRAESENPDGSHPVRSHLQDRLSVSQRAELGGWLSFFPRTKLPSRGPQRPSDYPSGREDSLQ